MAKWTDPRSRIASFVEANANWIVGLPITYAMYAYVAPIVAGISPSHKQNLALTTMFTLISIVRSYLLRRLFEKGRK